MSFNQIVNPGFELGLLGWTATGQVTAEQAGCEGRFSALFTGSGTGSLSQVARARGVDGNYLFLFLAGATGGTNGSPITATVTALNRAGQPITTLANIVVPPGFLPDVTGATPTECVEVSTILKHVPIDTFFFEVTFSKSAPGGGGLLLDHVLLGKFTMPRED